MNKTRNKAINTKAIIEILSVLNETIMAKIVNKNPLNITRLDHIEIVVFKDCSER